jgi:beta-mannosidase
VLHGADSSRIATDNSELHRGLGIHASYIGREYTPTSPLSNWGNAEGLNSGDLHYWGVWHGDSAFSSFKNNVGRFVSEYGFQSYPDSALLSHYIDPQELYLGSPAMKRMQRSYKTDKPIWDAIERELGKKPKTLGEFIKDSQEVQAKAYRMAIEAHMAAQPRCMGTLFWQLNDCWPGPSWSLIDFEGKWKPGMYEVQRLYGR